MATTLTDLDYAMRHKYRVEPGGAFVPGVTTIIGVVDKPGLKWAASQIAAETAKAREGSVLVGTGKPAVPDDVGHQDRRELSGLAHGASRPIHLKHGV